jgi:predicted nucleic acid-binding protein
MPKVLLDTDILSEYLKGHDKKVARRAADYAQQHGLFTFTSVTVHELVYGFEFKGASGQLKKALDWLNRQVLGVARSQEWNGNYNLAGHRL